MVVFKLIKSILCRNSLFKFPVLPFSLSRSKQGFQFLFSFISFFFKRKTHVFHESSFCYFTFFLLTFKACPNCIKESSHISTNHLKWVWSKVFDNKYTSRPCKTFHCFMGYFSNISAFIIIPSKHCKWQYNKPFKSIFNSILYIRSFL